MALQDFLNTMAKYTVLAALQDKVVEKIEFTLGSWTVNPSLFQSVATAVTSGHIKVVCDAAHEGRAYYVHEDDQIELGFAATAEVSQLALIIHECVHAGFDLKWLSGMEIAASEAAGYVAQCVFARAYSEKPDDPDYRLYSNESARDGVFAVGWRLAGKVLASEKLTDKDYQAMTQAVLRHPDYGHGRDIAAWNGLEGYRYATRSRR